MQVQIRKVKENEVAQLQQFGKQTFIDAFGSLNTKENIRQYLDARFTLSQIQSEFENKDSQFFFLTTEEEILGYLKLNTDKAQSESIFSQGLEIERIYISGKFIGEGLGKQLLQFAIEKAQKKNCKQIWLGVWDKNFKAIKFYERHGFVKFNAHEFMLGDEQQTDILMKLDLV